VAALLLALAPKGGGHAILILETNAGNSGFTKDLEEGGSEEGLLNFHIKRDATSLGEIVLGGRTSLAAE
jgi:hypothetical protein